MTDTDHSGSNSTSISNLGENAPWEKGPPWAPIDIISSNQYGLNVCFDILIHTFQWGHEIKWKIEGPKTNDSCYSTRVYENGYLYRQRCCLPTRETEFNLTCIDTFGDGWHGANLEIDGQHYCQNFKGDHMTVSVPNPVKKECEVPHTRVHGSDSSKFSQYSQDNSKGTIIYI